MKKVYRAVILFLILAISAFMAMACQKDNGDIEIYVDASDMPSRTTFVRGQELDLFGGTLTVVSNGQTSYVSLDDPDITLTYDQDKLDVVPVTIEYKGATTVIDIKFVPRLEIKDIALDFFVGESFDTSKGSLVYNDDTGSSKTYPLTDSGIKINGFDTSTVGAKNGEIEYGDYIESFSYKVHTLASKDYGTPKKTDYQSHETQIDLSGGYIQYKSSDDYVRRISLTTDMVQGFHPEQANIEHKLPAKALAQTITINFPGFDFETSDKGINFNYNIDVHYSNVSFIKDSAKELKDFEFHYDETTGRLIYPDSDVLTDALVEKAVEASKLFTVLDGEDKELITEEEIAWIARPAVVGYYNKFYNELIEYSDIFVLNSNAVNFVLKTYDDTKEFYNEFSEEGAKDKPVCKTNQFLIDFLSEDAYWDLRTVDAITDPEYADMGGTLEYFFGNVLDFNSFIDTYIPAIGKMLELFDMLDETVIPASWTYETLTATQKNAIESMYDWLTTNMSSYPGSDYGTTQSFRIFYTLISKWRNSDDFFDIILTHYYNKAISAADWEKDEINGILFDIVNNYQFPRAIEDVYTNFNRMLTEYNNIYQYASRGYYYEAISFIRYYLDNVALLDNVKSDDCQDELSKYIIDNIGVYGILTSNGVPVSVPVGAIMQTMRNNIYLTFVGDMADVKEFDDIWRKFGQILKSDASGEYIYGGEFTDKFKTDISELIAMYNALTPMMQYGFFNSFSLNDFSAFAQNEDGSFVTTFANYIFGYLGSLRDDGEISEDIYQIVGDLFIAQDSFNMSDYVTFIYNMRQAETKYKDLSIDDLQKFNGSQFKSFYDKLIGIQALYNADAEYVPTLEGQEAELMDGLLNDVSIAVMIIQTILSDANNDGVSDVPIYGVYVAAYEKVYESLQLLQAAMVNSQSLYNTYYYGAYDLDLGEGDNSPENWIWILRSYFSSYLRSLSVPYKGETVLLNDIYEESGLRDFVKLSADFILAVSLIEDGATIPDMSKISLEEVKTIINAFNEMDDEQEMAFVSMHQAYDLTFDMYLYGMVFYFADTFEYDASNDNNIIFTLYRMQMAYLDYVYIKTYNTEAPEELLQSVEDAYNTAVSNLYAARDSLSSEAKEQFEDIFGETVKHCVKYYAA